MPTTWYIARDGKQHGPVTDVEFRKLVELGHLKVTDYVWHDGAPDWMPAAQVLELAPAAAGPAPAAGRLEPQRQPAPAESASPRESAGGSPREGTDPRSRDLRPAAPAVPAVPLAQRRLVIAAAAVVMATLIGALAMVASDKFLGSGFFESGPDRATVAQQLRANAPHLDDDGLIRYAALIGDQMEAFGQRNPDLCVRLLHGQTDIGDVRAYLPEALQAQEMQLLEEARLAARSESASRRRFTKAEQIQVMQAILTKLAKRHGELVNLINPETPAAGRERDACKIGTALFREIAALPGTNSAALMRSLLTVQK
jgi:hypothetical protein